jgi:hypothetical protein
MNAAVEGGCDCRLSWYMIFVGVFCIHDGLV